MRILIVSIFFPPLNSIASHRPYSWAKYWTLAGHDVTVATTSKNHFSQQKLPFENPGFRMIEVPLPHWIDFLKSDYQQSQTDRGQDSSSPSSLLKQKWLIKLYHYLRYRKGILNASRMPDFTDFWIAPTVKKLRQEAPWDLIVSTAGPYSVHFVASKLKKLGLGQRWIADFRDLWVDNHIFPGLFPFNYFERHLEKYVLKKADKITVVSSPWAENLASRHGQERVHIIENGFDCNDLNKLPKSNIFPDDGKFRIVHTGMVYPGRQKLELLFEAICRLKKDPSMQSDIESLEVVFAGPELGYIEELRKRYNLGELIKNWGFVKREEALCMQRDAHVVLFFPWSDPLGTGSGLLSGKIYEYLYSKTPILALGGQQGQAAEKIIEESKAGVTLKDVSDIEAYLKKSLADRKKGKVEATDKYLERYSRKNLALKLLELGSF